MTVAATIEARNVSLRQSCHLLVDELHALSGQFSRGQDMAGDPDAVLTAMPGGVVVIDRQGIVAHCNPVAIDMLGTPLLGESWAEVIGRAILPRVDDGHEISLRDGRRVGISTRAMPDGNGQLVLLHDLTESRAWQEAIGHQKRVYALGQMAATLAHQLRTPLSSALLYAAHLGQTSLDEARRQQFADRLLERLRAMEAQIQMLLLFSRQQLPLTDRLSADDLHAQCQQLVDDIDPCRIHIERAAALPAGRVACHLTALREAISNLLVNALEASSPAGVVSLRLSASDASTVCIEVSDQGVGMNEATLARAQEPFYSTKAQGTGLGLALVKRLVQAHSGQLHIQSQMGQGTTVTVCLPTVEQE